MFMHSRLARRHLSSTFRSIGQYHAFTNSHCYIVSTQLVRSFSSEKEYLPDKPKYNEKSNGLLDVVVDKLNDSIKKYPAESIGVLFASDIGSIFGMYALLSLSGIEFSTEFAFAFAASRPFRRIRLPLDLAAAAAVAKIFPAFTRVHLSELTGAIPSDKRAEVFNSKSSVASSLVSKTMTKARDVIDNYGAAYMMGSRLTGVAVICALYGAIKHGIDVMPLLEKLGFEGAGNALGSYAAAVVFSSAFYPVTLGMTGYLVPYVAKARKNLMP